MVGIRDVAKYAGVSPSTVSRALSGVAFVEPETKEKVMKAVSDLNYKPNLAARSLKKRRQQADRPYHTGYHESILSGGCKIYGGMRYKGRIFPDSV